MNDAVFSAKNEAGRLIQRARSIIHNRGMYSNLSEERIIRKYLAELDPSERFVVDIGAEDGRTMSNTFRLFLDGFGGVAFERDKREFAKLALLYRRFPSVLLLNVKVTPGNINALLKAADTPEKFAFLSLDIDSYDYYVLESVLSEYRPLLVCAEINETIRPPLEFTVEFDPDFCRKPNHFMGQSLSQLYKLAKRFKYDLVELHYNNAFLIPHSRNRHKALSPKEAFEEGYLNKPDRKKKFPWNIDMEEALHLPPGEAKKFIEKKFAEYRGKYKLSAGGK